MHTYTKDGIAYPSVTTIVHALGSEELMKWSNIMGFKHRKIEDILDKTSKFGTLVHSHLQSIVDPDRGIPLPVEDGIDAFDLTNIVSRFKRYISRFTYQTIYTEKSIVSSTLGYGGTLDWYAKMGDKLQFNMLNDFKTSKRVQVNMLFQLGGYYNLLKEIGEEPDGCSIIIINRNACSLNPFNLKDLQLFGSIFNELASFYNMSREIKVSPDLEMLSDLTTW